MYEAVITSEKGIGYSVEFPDVPGCVTQGENLEDAYAMAYDALGLMLEDMHVSGRELPEALYGRKASGNETIAVFAINTDNMDFTEKYITVAQAEDMLGVSHQRVHALIRSGDILSEKFGTARMIEQESVIAYRDQRKGSGRPKKIAI